MESGGQLPRYDTSSRLDLTAYHETHAVLPALVFVTGGAIYTLGMIVIGLSHSVCAVIGASAVSSICAGKIFVIGHDACHNSFTTSRRLNRIIALISLALSFHVEASWRYWHNIVHHAYTNDLSKDFVWRPLSKDEFKALGSRRAAMQRFYRHHSGIGMGPYYFLEILLPKMLWPPHLSAISRTSILSQPLLFYCIQGGVIGWLCVSAIAVSDLPIPVKMAENLLYGYLVPLFYVCYSIGFVVYFNHTHPTIPWRNGQHTDPFESAQVEATLCLRFRGLSEFLLPNEIMNHVAHHLDTLVPIRKLRRAQDHLLKTSPSVKQEEWCWKWHRSVMKRCKLYDPNTGEWLDFDN